MKTLSLGRTCFERLLALVGVLPTIIMISFTASASPQGVIDTLEDIGLDGTAVTTRLIDGVTVSISSTSGATMTARTYSPNTAHQAFQGFNGQQNVPLNPGNVSGTRFISTVVAFSEGFIESQPLVFSFSSPVSKFGLTTLDLLEDFTQQGSTVTLTAFDASGPIDEHVMVNSQGGSGLDLDFVVSSSSIGIIRAELSGSIATGNPHGYGIDDLVVERSLPGGGFCFGDPASGISCPCSNDNDGTVQGSGCANSYAASGAQLFGSGTASVGNDSLVLSVTGAIPLQNGLFFQAENDLSPGVVWGSGLRCAGTDLVRLHSTSTDSGGSASTGIVTISIVAGNVSAGDTKYYQYWYRDPQGVGCGNVFNTSNGYAVYWLP